MADKQPEALRLAEYWSRGAWPFPSSEQQTRKDTAAELRRLHAEVEALRADKALLDSGRIMTNERDDFGLEYQCERRGLDLRAAISAAIAASKE